MSKPMDTIDRVEVFCLHIPYRSEVRYASTRDTHGVFTVLRLTTKDGAVGISRGRGKTRSEPRRRCQNGRLSDRDLLSTDADRR